MPKFRPECRWPEDDRILVISDPKDFALFKQAQELEIEGIIYPYNPFSKKEDEALLKYCLRKLVKKDSFSIASFISCNSDPSKKSKCYETDTIKKASLLRIYSDPTKKFGRAVGVPDSVRVMVKFMLTARKDAGLKESTIIDLRYNSNYPTEPHAHAATLTYAFHGNGTVIVKPDGSSYSVPPKHVALIGPTLLHMAPQKISRQNSRINLVL